MEVQDEDYGTFGNILNEEQLQYNLKENCIPADITAMTINDYDCFLAERRKLMVAYIWDYYLNL